MRTCTHGACGEAAVAVAWSPLDDTWCPRDDAWCHFRDDAWCHFHVQVHTGGRRSPHWSHSRSVRIVPQRKIRAVTKDNIVTPRNYRRKIVRWLSTTVIG